MTPLFKFALGPDPYPELSLEYWGERRGKFPDLETALHGLFLAHPFPVALAGRREGRYLPGISLEGAASHEVVQVWSTEPEAVKRFSDALEEHVKIDVWHYDREGYVPHDGHGNHMGLACEVHVGMIARFQVPLLAGLLTDGSAQGMSASPAGRMALSFTPQARGALMLRMFQSQLANVRNRQEMGEACLSLREQLGKMNEGIRLLNSYCNGTHTLEKLHSGERAPCSEPYRIFQTRIYIGEELGLIANLVDMDHQNMAAVDDWLMRGDRWKKLLPLPKCILVSRIRRDEKKYGDVFETAYHNAYNMESLVWVRDGECVWRFATDIHFEERVFPTTDDAPALVSLIQEAIWKGHFAEKQEDPWRSSRNAPVVIQDPTDADEPVPVRWGDEVTYKTLHEFLDSEDYPPEVNLSIQRQAADAVRRNSRESMPFALLLQGIIDFKGILNIPAGTDLFNTEEQAKYIQLVSDFGGVLTDSRNSNQFAALTKKEALKPGDRIVGWQYSLYTEKYSFEAKWNIGSANIQGPFVFTVHHVELRDPSKQYSRDRIYVHHWQLSRRWVSGKSPFTRVMGMAEISDDFLPIDLSEDLANKLLDDREWKRGNTWAVPVLAQWSFLRSQFKDARTEVPFKLAMKGVEEL